MRKALLLFTIIFCLNSCNNDNQPITETDKLPPATQTGDNTIGCLVNGKALLPHGGGLFSPSPTECLYGEYPDSFSLRLSDLRGDSKSVAVAINGITLEEGKTYLLDKNYTDDGYKFTGGAGSYNDYSAGIYNEYHTNTVKTGELKTTRIDLSNRIISGTFWFDAVNDKNEKVEVREGRFDMHF